MVLQWLFPKLSVSIVKILYHRDGKGLFSSMNPDKLRLIVQICKMYFHEELSQNEIADRLYISRPQVSKLITKAKRNNIVSVNINDPFSNEYLLAEKLKKRYRLENAVVIDMNGLNHKEAFVALARSISIIFTSYIVNGSLIGISAGYTVAACSKYTNIYNCRNLRFVALIAGESFEGEEWYANSNCSRFANRLGGKYTMLNTPFIIREDKVRRQLEENMAVKPVLDCYNNLDVILLGIGQTSLGSTLDRCSMSKEEIIWAYEHGAKAIIGASFIDAGGNEMLQGQSDIFMGIKADQIRKCKSVIAVAMGREKIEAIKAVLKGEYINVLGTDLEVAKELVK
ncbi:MAG: MarR family transcriptional regulator [Firmicutes bacterium]|nr:MarR family transcriptional regulator [Bacillota bacterium]